MFERPIPSCIPTRLALETTDVQQSGAFYEALTGWEWELQESDSGDLAICKKDGIEVARMVETSGVPRWTVLFESEDPEVTLELARDLGHSTAARPAWGEAWEIETLDGTNIGVVETTEGRWNPQVGGLALVEIATWNVESSRTVARQLLGIDSKRVPDDPDDFHVLMASNRPVAGLLNMENLYPPTTQPHVLAYLGTDDCDSALLTAVDLGGRVRVPPLNTILGRYAVVEDSVGAVVGLIPPVTEEIFIEALSGASGAVQPIDTSGSGSGL